MKKLLTIILLIASANSYAEWTQLGYGNEVTQYIDIATIRRNGNFVKMWDLTEEETVQNFSGGSYLSGVYQLEYDCKEERSRILAFSWFSGKMGNGKVVYSNSDPGKWFPIQPGSFGESLWKIACAHILHMTK